MLDIMDNDSRSNYVDNFATNLGTERRIDETNSELYDRLIDRYCRFRFKQGSYYELVHICEQAILHNSPVSCDVFHIRQTVALNMLNKNKPTKFFQRIRLAFKAFWSIVI